jgi:hypothetical protein
VQEYTRVNLLESSSDSQGLLDNAENSDSSNDSEDRVTVLRPQPKLLTIIRKVNESSCLCFITFDVISDMVRVRVNNSNIYNNTMCVPINSMFGEINQHK